MLAATFLVSACGSKPPTDSDNICSVFEEKPKWLKHARKSESRWGTPIHVQMAIMYQESRYVSDARPGRKKILWVIPGPRKSSAFGFAQVKDETWDWYRKETGNRGADRDKFKDAIDFIGWYTQVSQQRLGISKWDPRNQYLAYHEGHGGYERGSYRAKQWLLDVASRVDTNARNWGVQLKQCGLR